MRTTTNALVFIMCLNVAATAFNSLGWEPAVGVLPSMNYTYVRESLNASSIVGSWGFWSPVTAITGDILAGLNYAWNALQNLVLGFPLMLSYLGVPAPLVYALEAVWLLVIMLWVIQFISGRPLE